MVGVETVQAALAVIADATERVDVVVTDYQLPDGTGADVIDALDRHRPSVPRLVTTGYMKADDPRLADVPVVPKPFTPSALKEAVARVLDTETQRAAAG